MELRAVRPWGVGLEWLYITIGLDTQSLGVTMDLLGGRIAYNGVGNAKGFKELLECLGDIGFRSHRDDVNEIKIGSKDLCAFELTFWFRMRLVSKEGVHKYVAEQTVVTLCPVVSGVSH